MRRQASDNAAVVIRNGASALRALHTGGLDAVVGLRECAWLDAKEGPYKLGHPAQDAELCKDAAALANARGGLLLVGYGTLRRRGREVLARLAPGGGQELRAEQGADAEHALDHRGEFVPVKPALDERVGVLDLLAEGHHLLRQGGDQLRSELLAGQCDLLAGGGGGRERGELARVAHLALAQPGFQVAGAGWMPADDG